MPARILVVDDHEIVREAFRAILERAGFEIVGEAGDGWTAVRLAQSQQPDLVLMDISMPLLNGIDAAREILAALPRVRVVLLAVHVDEYHVLAALGAGVHGYVTKTQSATELLDAVREVLAGGTYLTPKVSEVVIHAYLGGRRPAIDPLTPRERQVLQLVAEGKTTKDVAGVLDVTVKTAEYYRARVKRKLAIHHTAGLVRYAIRQGVAELALAFCCGFGCVVALHEIEDALALIL